MVKVEQDNIRVTNATLLMEFQPHPPFLDGGNFFWVEIVIDNQATSPGGSQTKTVFFNADTVNSNFFRPGAHVQATLLNCDSTFGDFNNGYVKSAFPTFGSFNAALAVANTTACGLNTPIGTAVVANF